MTNNPPIDARVLEEIRTELDHLLAGLDPPSGAKPNVAAIVEMSHRATRGASLELAKPPRWSRSFPTQSFSTRSFSTQLFSTRRAWLIGLAVVIVHIGAAAAGVTLVMSSRLNAAVHTTGTQLTQALTLAAHEVHARKAAEDGVRHARKQASDALLTHMLQGAPDVRRRPVEGGVRAPTAVGQAWWSPTLGLALAARRVPSAPAGLSHRVWLVTTQRAVDLGALDHDEHEIVSGVFDAPLGLDGPAVGALVTVEPPDGSRWPSDSVVLQVRF